MDNWGTAETDAHARCGHCDNCARPAEAVEKRDVTIDSWKILRLCQAVKSEGGRVTLPQLTDLARGLGGGTLEVKTKGRKKRGRPRKEEVGFDLDQLIGGKAEMSKEVRLLIVMRLMHLSNLNQDTERLILHLLLSNYLEETFHATEYSVNSYLAPGPKAYRISRFELEELEAGRGHRIDLAFLIKNISTKKATKRTKDIGGSTAKAITRGTKRKSGEVPLPEEGYDGDFIDEDETMPLFADDDIDPEEKIEAFAPGPSKRSERSENQRKRIQPYVSSEADADDSWNFSMTDETSIKSLPSAVKNLSFTGPSVTRYTNPPITNASKASDFTSSTAVAKPALISSLMRSMSHTNPSNHTPIASPQQTKRGAFTPSMTNVARTIIGKTQTPISVPVRSFKQPKATEPCHQDVIEINSDDD